MRLAVTLSLMSVLSLNIFAQTEHSRSEKRLLEADAVVVGKVIEVFKPNIFHSAVSEHNPDWYVARVEVDKVLSGLSVNVYEKAILNVYFPASVDHDWYKAPKFKENQKGIWALRYHQNPVLAKHDPGMMAALDPLDFRKTGELKQIRSILAAR